MKTLYPDSATTRERRAADDVECCTPPQHEREHTGARRLETYAKTWATEILTPNDERFCALSFI